MLDLSCLSIPSFVLQRLSWTNPICQALSSEGCFEFLGNRPQEVVLCRPEGFPMNVLSVRGLAILGAIFVTPPAIAQNHQGRADSTPPILLLETRNPNSNPTLPVRLAEADPFQSRPKSPVRSSKTSFVLLSAAVYGASLADMHQTLEVRKFSWWYETDPLARPIVRLPAPAYYVTGLALATSVNWLSWKMAHSRRWRRLSPIPQLLSIGGNLYGFHSNRL
jgi:hypothetical protein